MEKQAKIERGGTAVFKRATYTLTEALIEDINKLAKDGRYGSKSEIVRMALNFFFRGDTFYYQDLVKEKDYKSELYDGDAIRSSLRLGPVLIKKRKKEKDDE